jgi:hypothetical protein
MQRVLAGDKDMCGEGFKETEVCVTAEFGTTGTFVCPPHHMVAEVMFASYGRVNKFIGPRCLPRIVLTSAVFPPLEECE